MSAVCAQASGHALLVSRGEVMIEPENLSLRIRVSTEDFLHRFDLGPDPQRVSKQRLATSVREWALHLSRLLIVRDAAGAPLECSSFEVQDPDSTSSPPTSAGSAVAVGSGGADHPHSDGAGGGSISVREVRATEVLYQSDCRMPNQPAYLTFQILPSEAPPGPAWQIALAIRGQAAGPAATLRLTSGGNAETVEVVWASGRAKVAASTMTDQVGSCIPCQKRGPGSLKQVCVEFDRQSPEFRADLYIPLPLLATWLNIARLNRDYVTPAEQRELQPAAAELLADAFIVSSEGPPRPVEVKAISFVPLAGEFTADSTLSFWTTRLHARLQIAGKNQDQPELINWRLFNGAISTISAIMTIDGRCLDHEFSSYDSDYEIPPG